MYSVKGERVGFSTMLASGCACLQPFIGCFFAEFLFEVIVHLLLLPLADYLVDLLEGLYAYKLELIEAVETCFE